RGRGWEGRLWTGPLGRVRLGHRKRRAWLAFVLLGSGFCDDSLLWNEDFRHDSGAGDPPICPYAICFLRQSENESAARPYGKLFIRPNSRHSIHRPNHQKNESVRARPYNSSKPSLRSKRSNAKAKPVDPSRAN